MKVSDLEEDRKVKVYCNNGIVYGNLVRNGSKKDESYWYLAITNSENSRLNKGEYIRLLRPDSSFPAASCINKIEKVEK